MQDTREQSKEKEFLRSIAENNYQIPTDIDAFEFAKNLMANLSLTDEEIRDDLSYMTLASGIIGQQKLSHEQLEKLLNYALDEEHAFFRIGEVGTDSIFMRSFSNLVVAAILFNDANDPALSWEALHATKNALLRYAHEEKDWRGYVEGKGWAHAMAHLADALDECAQNARMTPDDRKEIMLAVSELASLAEPLYHEEDVRLANVAYHVILGKMLDDEFLSTWLASCAVSRDVNGTRVTNARNFLRSLFFFLHWDGVATVLSTEISSLLKQKEDFYVERHP
jgi:Protein of unknown function (DUF2785)